MARDIALNEQNSTVATPAAAPTRRARRRRSLVGPVKTVSILGLVGAFATAIILPAFAGAAAPAPAPVAAVEEATEAQPQELVVASTVNDAELERNSLSATSAGEIEEAKRQAEREAEAERQRLALLAALEQSGSSPAMLASASASSLSGTGSVTWPTLRGPSITSEYGYRWGRMHEGVDFAASYEPLYSIAEGVVTAVYYHGGFGNHVVIEHYIGGQKVTSLYAHMSSYGVSVGDYVSAGQFVGNSGNTGASQGPHLHFELRINGALVNPLNWLYNNVG